jgi:magnesium transporter
MGKTMPELEALSDSPWKMFIFLSELLHRPVLTHDGRQLGRLTDLKIRLGDMFPRVTAVLLKTRRSGRNGIKSLDWETIERINSQVLHLHPGAEERLVSPQIGSEEILLCEEILDKQVVDTHGAKIERVNDIHLLIARQDLHVIHAEIGMRGILRRLGWLRVIDGLSNWLFAYHMAERLVSWKFVQPLAGDTVGQDLKLNLHGTKLRDIHPSDLADILEELDRANRARIFTALDPETAAGALQELEDPKLQRSLLESAPAERASDIIEEMEPDEATDLLADMPQEQQQQIIDKLEEPVREDLEELLQFPEGTAGGIMTTEYIALGGQCTFAEALDEIRRSDCSMDSLSYIYVIAPDDLLLGVQTLLHLLSHPAQTRLREQMDTNLVTVSTDASIKEIGALFRKYKFMAIPVVDDGNRICGIVTIHDIIEAGEWL